MRRQFTKTVEEIMAKDPKVALILGDIGVHGFKKVFETHPERTYNIGILEQSTMSAAAGMAMTGLIPIVHSIAPFIVERCYEQIKDDFGYQGLGGNIVSVGASYDYAALGCTHHCPADVAILSQIPGINIFVPGSAIEFDQLFKENYNNGKLNYFRLSEEKTIAECHTMIQQEGKKGTVIVVGSLLDKVMEAVKDLDVTVEYHTNTNFKKNKYLFYVEPYYSDNPGIHVPRKFLKNYGTREEHDIACGFTVDNIRGKIKEYFNL